MKECREKKDEREMTENRKSPVGKAKESRIKKGTQGGMT